ncbi:class 1 fructose-bisphosphatase [Halospeciosus flavus]|uniref:Fructose-1,6-bisphosphatase class 1 n=1 Tax=Halospeciosus flavus TaxID=3032283 RepID=A0ABD5Z3M5_9EURY|nr:class 1 fructose-bisphosphatase [Halospeciosus flavus]
MTGDVVDRVFDVLAASAPEIRAGLPGRRTKTAETNESGERQLAADLWADDLLQERFLAVDGVGAYASEERETIESASETEADDLAVAVDPLDGSSNLKSNNPMGTVLGVYEDDLPASGRSLVGAAFVLYGPITTLVTAREISGGEVRATEYVVEDGDRREVGTVELPADPTVYGFGGRVSDWTDDFQTHVRGIEQETDLKLRYGGAMIADVSQVLTYGGIFGYPGLRERPEGKLRLLFEGAPMAYIIEAAGGASSDGEQSLLDVEAESLHQRTPVFLGSEELVDDVETALR